MCTSQLALSRLWPLELGAGPGLVGVGGQSAIRWMCTFVRNICQSRRLRFVVNTRKRHTAPNGLQSAHRNAQNSPTPGPGARGAARPGGAGPRGAGHRGRPGAPQRPRQTPRAGPVARQEAQPRAEPRLDQTVRPHTRHAAPAVNILRTYTVSHARTLRAAVIRPYVNLDWRSPEYPRTLKRRGSSPPNTTSHSLVSRLLASPPVGCGGRGWHERTERANAGRAVATGRRAGAGEDVCVAIGRTADGVLPPATQKPAMWVGVGEILTACGTVVTTARGFDYLQRAL